MRRIKVHEGEIYYDWNNNRVFQIRKSLIEAGKETVHLCSGYTEYIGDTKTTISTMVLSDEYIRTKCEHIRAYDKCEHLENNTIGWRVKPLSHKDKILLGDE